jgi:hypothetical protein
MEKYIITVQRISGEWRATATLRGHFIAGCSSKSKPYSLQCCREDADAYLQRQAAKAAAAAEPAAPAPNVKAGRQGGAAKVGSFSMYLSRLGGDRDIIRAQAPAKADQVAQAA